MVGGNCSLRWLDTTFPQTDAELILNRVLLKRIEMGERFESECCIRPGGIANAAEVIPWLCTGRRHLRLGALQRRRHPVRDNS